MHPLQTVVTTYLKEIRDQRKLANTTDELSYRFYLGKLLRDSAAILNRNADFTDEAKKIVVGRLPFSELDHVFEDEVESLTALLTVK